MKIFRCFASWGHASSCFLMLTFCLIPFWACSADHRSSVGGPCEYKKYEGIAEIISVIERSGATEEFEIKFVFHPQETILEEFARQEGRSWSLVRHDFSYPKKDFLTQYDIKPGKRLPCYLKAITRGTCTPVLFEFPTIPQGGAQ